MPRVGIYAGTFDPVHSGHLSFALHALKVASLDTVFFLPERKPRYKPGAEHYGHRVAMLRRAVRPHLNLGIIELPDRAFTVQRTLRQLKQALRDQQLVFLMGADVFTTLPTWNHIGDFLGDSHFVVSSRSAEDLKVITVTMHQLGLPTARLTITDSLRPAVSSSRIREALRRTQAVEGLLPSVNAYARREWLYARVQ